MALETRTFVLLEAQAHIDRIGRKPIIQPHF